MEESYPRCPVCEKPVQPSADIICEHFLCTLWDGEVLHDYSGFADTWESLRYYFQNFIIEPDTDEDTLYDGLETACNQLPPKHKKIINALLREDTFFWTKHFKCIPFHTGGMASGAGSHYFCDKMRFLDELTRNIEAAQFWFSSYVEENS